CTGGHSFGDALHPQCERQPQSARAHGIRRFRDGSCRALRYGAAAGKPMEWRMREESAGDKGSVLVAEAALRECSEGILHALGVAPEDAAQTVDVFLQAEL